MFSLQYNVWAHTVWRKIFTGTVFFFCLNFLFGVSESTFLATPQKTLWVTLIDYSQFDLQAGSRVHHLSQKNVVFDDRSARPQNSKVDVTHHECWSYSWTGRLSDERTRCLKVKTCMSAKNKAAIAIKHKPFKPTGFVEIFMSMPCNAHLIFVIISMHNFTWGN